MLEAENKGFSHTARPAIVLLEVTDRIILFAVDGGHSIMHAHSVEHAFVSIAGLLLGAGLAMCIISGDILLPLVAAVTLAVFFRELLKDILGTGRPAPHNSHAADDHR